MILTMRDSKKEYPRDLEEDFKLFCRSTPEVFEALSAIVSRVGSERSILFKGRLRPKKAQVMNAIILYLESLSIEDQVGAIRVGMEKLNQILSMEMPSAQKETLVKDEGQKPVIRGVDGKTSVPKNPKKRSGGGAK
jgi:hypothetical protein